jgi:kumamolisin
MRTRTLLWLLSLSLLSPTMVAVPSAMAQQAPLNLGQMRLNPGYVVLTAPQARMQIIDPASGRERRPGYAHTNVKIGVPPGGYPQIKQNTAGPPLSGYLIETPASLACVYGLVARSNGCNPNIVTVNSSGGSKAVAIVDAYDYGKSAAAADLAQYTSQFGLPAANLTVVYGTGSPSAGCKDGAQPTTSSGTGWDVEEAIDMEMAVAMAPGAHIYLVEANSNSFADLLNAEQIATACVQAAGGGQVTNSWGGDEFSGESSYDTYFNGSTVTYFASAGDSPGVEYPAASPNVIGIGGTTFIRDYNGNFLQETVWNYPSANEGTGGGPSQYESRPAYQNFMSSIVGGARGTPDLAGIADPNTGVWVYNTSSCAGWCIYGGTSVASPLMAAIFNKVGLFFGSSYGALANNIYPFGQSGKIDTIFTWIQNGTCGPPGSASYPNSSGPPFDPQNTYAVTGIPWSYCAGWGAVKDAGKPNFLK